MTRTATRKKLPIGIQTFRKIREEDCYYVDKTQHLLKLIDEGVHYFLSRPRRFGKSLLVDTLAELFAGNEGLFQGLYIHPLWDWSRSYPVVRFSFSDGLLKSPEGLESHIRAQLQDNQRRLGVQCTPPWDESVSLCLAQLIRLAHEKHGQRAVVLVDEYDKPILDNLGDRELARQMRDDLLDLFSVFKEHGEDIEFSLITGVSEFPKAALFSGLNNLEDITLLPDYSSLCGYTEQDLETVFAPELEGLDRDKIRHWYNGYNWLGEAVYNPFDVLLLLQDRLFRPWWFETGSPAFLIDLLMERQIYTPELSALQTDLSLLSSFDVDHIATEALLFQAGYLTIGDVEDVLGMQQYTLRYPNHEVETCLNLFLARALVKDPSAQNHNGMRLYRLLQANDFDGMQALFTAFYAGIPHAWHANNPIQEYEGYYASVFYSYFAGLGLDIVCEDMSSKGRLDMMVTFNRQYYLFEFKVVEETPKGRALDQIKERGYADKYAAAGWPIHLIGMEFSKESRSVVGFEVEHWEKNQ